MRTATSFPGLDGRCLSGLAIGVMAAAIMLIGRFEAARAQDGLVADGLADRAFVLSVVDQTSGEPIRGAAIQLQLNRSTSDQKTDADGRLAVVVSSGTTEFVRITARAEGYVPVYVSWRRAEDAIKVPKAYTLRLERGTTIGGLIKDEEGRPIAGATVYLLVPGQDRPGEPRASLWDYPVKTDAQGHWQCDLMPSDLDDIWIRLNHPDHVSDTMYGATPKPAMAQLRDQTGVMIMKQGMTVAGRVIDAASGKPLEGAAVAQGRDRFGSHFPDTKTDADGRFTFSNVKPGELVLTVQVKGHAPDLKTITVAAGLEPVDFRLTPGATVRGRLVDPDGMPVAGAFVAADTWRGYRSLEWRVQTDAEGRFRWDEAPPDAVLVDLGKQGYLSVRRHAMTPSDEEYTITLPRPVRVRGTVVDAQTGQPVRAFTIVTGINWEGGRAPHWERERARPGAAGRYEVRFTEPYPIYLVRIEAPGYKPAVSPPFPSTGGDQVFDARLEPGRDATGVVLLPDAAPLEGADVVIVPADQHLFLQDGRAPDRRSYHIVRTYADGRFHFPPLEAPFVVLVLHDRGYARRTSAQLAADEVVPIQPWGRIEGTLHINTRPGAAEQLNLRATGEEDQLPRPGISTINFGSRATADSEGRFAFDRVPPGKAHVSRVVRINDRTTTDRDSTEVDVEPGRTARVEIGGTGRPVDGKPLKRDDDPGKGANP